MSLRAIKNVIKECAEIYREIEEIRKPEASLEKETPVEERPNYKHITIPVSRTAYCGHYCKSGQRAHVNTPVEMICPKCVALYKASRFNISTKGT